MMAVYVSLQSSPILGRFQNLPLQCLSRRVRASILRWRRVLRELAVGAIVLVGWWLGSFVGERLWIQRELGTNGEGSY